MITIITPTYNNGLLLKRLYSSIKFQTFKAIHWIIVDDGSTDNTELIVNNFSKLNITYIKQKNLGPNAARNNAEKKILPNYKYIIFIDSDDTFFNNNTVDKMFNEIEKAPKNIGAVGFTSIDGYTKKNYTYLKTSPMKVSYLDSIKGSKFSGEFISIQRKEVLKYSEWPNNISGYEAIRHWEINKHVDYLLVSNPGRVYYRDRKENLTSPESTVKRSFKMAIAINELIKQHGKALKKYAKNKYNYFLCTQALYFCLSGNKRKAIQALMNLNFIAFSIKNTLIFIFVLSSLLLPVKLSCKIYIYIKNLNYNYS